MPKIDLASIRNQLSSPGVVVYGAVLVGVILSLPAFSFTYLTDDYDFLARAQRFTPAQLLPEPGPLFYRPLSREVYFAALYALGPLGPFVGHCLNAALLASIILLSYRIVVRFASPLAASSCALAIACFSQWPLLVGWLSGIQDLLSIALVLMSMELALKGRLLPSALWFGGALLGKESALLALPAIATIPWLLRREAGWVTGLRRTLPYVAVTALWAAAHPGIQSLIHRRGVTGPGGYIGFDNERRWQFLSSMFGSVFNVHVPSGRMHISPELVVTILAAIAVLLVLVRPMRSLWGADDPNRDGVHAGRVAAILVGSALAIPTGVLPALFIKHWAPYYAVFPAVGTFIALGPLAARLSRRSLTVGFILYLIVGLSGRISDFGRPRLPTEASYAVLSSRLEVVEKRLRSVLSDPEPGSTLLVSIHAPRKWEIATHLLEYQAPRIWYRDPTLLALDPAEWSARGAPEHLVWVSNGLEVGSVREHAPRASGPDSDRDRAIRTYALGRAASGDAFNACRLLLTIDSGDPRARDLDRRLAVIVLLFNGRRELGERALSQLPPVSTEEGVQALRAVLPLRWPGAEGDSIAFRVFGVDYADSDSIRRIMHLLIDDELPLAALRLAERLQTLLPNDREAIEIAGWLRSIPDWERVTIQVDPWAKASEH
jgi:hypothetical protein